MPCKEVPLGMLIGAHQRKEREKKKKERGEGGRGKEGKNLNSWFKNFGKNFTTGPSLRWVSFSKI